MGIAHFVDLLFESGDNTVLLEKINYNKDNIEGFDYEITKYRNNSRPFALPAFHAGRGPHECSSGACQ